MGGHRRGNELLGREDSSLAHGAALGTGGIDTWWTWRSRRRIRRGVDAVSPGTLRGAINVTLWFVGLVAIAMAGIFVIGVPPVVATPVSIGIMVLIGRWWDRRP
jgi:hypothetical protein